MARSRTDDLIACLEFLRRIYAARSLDQFASEVLTGIRTVVPCALAAYNEYNTVRNRNQYVVDRPDGEPPGGAEVFNAFIHEHPLVRHSQETGYDGVVKISDLVTSPQFHRLGLYNEFFRRADPPVEDLVNFCFLSRGPRVLAIALCRPQRTFDEDERLVLDLLRDHLRQAYLSVEALERLEAVEHGLSALHEGLMFLDGRLRVRWESESAAGLLRAYFGPSRDSDSLPDVLRQWISRALAPLEVHDDFPAACLPLVVEAAGRRLVVRLLPQNGGCAVVLKEQRTCVEPALLRPLGLTRRESEVLAWLAQGKSDAEIASIVGASRRTVGKHLEHIYAKLGVEGRTGAAARALEVLSLSA